MKYNLGNYWTIFSEDRVFIILLTFHLLLLIFTYLSFPWLAGQDGSKMAPKWPQDGPKRAQDGSQTAQLGPNLAQVAISGFLNG